MATTVQTIQNALEHRAHIEGKREAEGLIETIPYLSTLTVYHDGENHEIEWHRIRPALLSALIEHMAANRLDKLTRELLESVNNIAVLKEGLEQHIQDG